MMVNIALSYKKNQSDFKVNALNKIYTNIKLLSIWPDFYIFESHKIKEFFVIITLYQGNKKVK